MIAVIPASSIKGTMPQYVRDLSREGIEVLLVPLEEVPIHYPYSSIGRKIDMFRHYAEKLSGPMLFSDGWDVTFYGTREELIASVPGDFVLQAAEKNCHPPECRGLNIPNAGPWQFANGGLALGTSEAFLRWCDACEAHPKYAPGMIDQHFMNMCLADGYDCGWKIDSETRTFFCLYGGYDELRFDRGRPVNSFYGTRPLLIHANGGWPTEKLFQMEAE